MNKNNKKIIVGMSGGVDSSISLFLLKKQGWNPIGVSLKYAVWQNRANLLRENVCCSAESFSLAEQICRKMDVPHHIVDVSKKFKKEVIEYFIKELKNNRTPNPCIICNRYLKFKELFNWGRKHDINYIATGHYARIEKDQHTGRFKLLVARDQKKDQTYSLCFLPQKWLKNIVFPLGELTKKEVFQIAKKQGLGFYLKRKQSQDFCFVDGKCLDCFLKKEIGKKEGAIEDTESNTLGKHQGLYFYTIGQRKGLQLPGGPWYVVDKVVQENLLVVSKDKKGLLAKEAILSPVNFIRGEKPTEKISLSSKIRSQHSPVEAILESTDSGKFKITFREPQNAITPGQFAVFYQGNICLGGGRIVKIT